jgi:protein-tyrosine phosphatase
VRSRGIALERTHNVRDLGGYRTEDDGTVRWNRLLRGSTTFGLPSEDEEVLLDYGLAAVIDLRDEDEAKAYPSAFASHKDVRYENVSMRNREREDEWQKEGAGGGMASWYVFLLERAKKEIHAALVILRSAVMSGCTLAQCNAGKDRTGIIAALVLRALRVPVQTVVEDYALSWQYLQPVREQLQREAVQRGDDPKLALRGWSANPEAMAETMAHIENRYDGVAGYLVSLGLEPEFSADLTEILLE